MMASPKNIDIDTSMPKQNQLAEALIKACAIQELWEQSEEIHDLEIEAKAIKNKFINLVDMLAREQPQGTEEGVLDLEKEVKATQNKVNEVVVLFPPSGEGELSLLGGTMWWTMQMGWLTCIFSLTWWCKSP